MKHHLGTGNAGQVMAAREDVKKLIDGLRVIEMRFRFDRDQTTVQVLRDACTAFEAACSPQETALCGVLCDDGCCVCVRPLGHPLDPGREFHWGIGFGGTAPADVHASFATAASRASRETPQNEGFAEMLHREPAVMAFLSACDDVEADGPNDEPGAHVVMGPFRRAYANLWAVKAFSALRLLILKHGSQSATSPVPSAEDVNRIARIIEDNYDAPRGENINAHALAAMILAENDVCPFGRLIRPSSEDASRQPRVLEVIDAEATSQPSADD